MLDAYENYIFLLNWSLYHMSCSSLSFLKIFVWKSILCDMSIDTPAFHFHLLEYLFISSLSVPVCPYFWNESLLGNTSVYSVFFYSFSHLCLLIGEFSPFTFKVIMNRCVLIATVLIIFWFFLCFLSVLFSLSLYPYILLVFFSVIFKFFCIFTISLFFVVTIRFTHNILLKSSLFYSNLNFSTFQSFMFSLPIPTLYSFDDTFYIFLFDVLLN